MWIFDDIITSEDTSTTVDTDSTVSTIEKPQINEENPLIIEDSQDSITNVTTSDIPDTAISFFEETPVSKEVVSESASLFNIGITEEPTITSSKEEVATETTVTDLFWNQENTSIIAQGTTSQVVGNPSEVLDNAISSLETFLTGHEDAISAKMVSIESKQAQINTLKQEIKALNDEAKNISEERTRVEKMIELFKSQKV